MIRAFLLTALLALMFTAPADAAVQKPAIFTDVHGVAIKGYDTVAYHLERRPRKGEPEFSHVWNDATWHFSSAENRDLFAADPERYAPQYGGYCAWAIARGRTAPINPKIFRIFDDKLYLNLNMKVHKDWLGKHGVYISRADAEWPSVLTLGD